LSCRIALSWPLELDEMPRLGLLDDQRLYKACRI